MLVIIPARRKEIPFSQNPHHFFWLLFFRSLEYSKLFSVEYALSHWSVRELSGILIPRSIRAFYVMRLFNSCLTRVSEVYYRLELDLGINLSLGGWHGIIDPLNVNRAHVD